MIIIFRVKRSIINDMINTIDRDESATVHRKYERANPCAKRLSVENDRIMLQQFKYIIIRVVDNITALTSRVLY